MCAVPTYYIRADAVNIQSICWHVDWSIHWQQTNVFGRQIFVEKSFSNRGDGMARYKQFSAGVRSRLYMPIWWYRAYRNGWHWIAISTKLGRDKSVPLPSTDIDLYVWRTSLVTFNHSTPHVKSLCRARLPWDHLKPNGTIFLNIDRWLLDLLAMLGFLFTWMSSRNVILFS